MSIVRKRPLPADSEQVDSSKKAEKPLASGRVTRPAKRRKTEEPSEKQNVAVDSKPSVAAVKMKRQAWSSVAIDAFFEGLYQHGKNFHRILQYMQGKQKKLNDPVIANLTRDQVRFFYYRTWRKVESLLNDSSAESRKAKPVPSPHPADGSRAMFEEDGENTLDLSVEETDISPQRLPPEGVAFSEVYNPTGELELEDKAKEHISATASITDKVEGKVKDTVVVNGVRQHIDLVALICYKKLKKKCSGDHNLGKKLSELVYHGTTTIPGRKRKVQIKIPNCVALRPAATQPQAAHGEPAPAAVAAPDDQAAAPEPPPSEAVTESLSELEQPPCSPVREEQHDNPPGLVAMELRPRTAAAWQYVQGLAQNPRLRVTVCGSQPLSHVIQFLCRKWQLDTSQDTSQIKLYSNHSPARSRSATPSLPPLPSSVNLPDSKSSSTGVNSSLSGSVAANHKLSSSDNEGRNTGAERSIQNPNKSCQAGGEESVLDGVSSIVASCEHSSGGGDKAPHKCSGKAAMAADSSGCRMLGEGGRSAFDSGPNSMLLDEHMSCSVMDILLKFHSPSRLELLYDIPKMSVEEKPIATVLKLVEYLRHSEATSTPIKSPSLRGIAQRSPKVKQYIQTLPRKFSPRKSPLSKYWRLKARSASINTSAKRALDASFRATDKTEDENVLPSSKLSSPNKTKPPASAAFAGLALQNVFSSVTPSPQPPPSSSATSAKQPQPTVTQKVIPPILPNPHTPQQQLSPANTAIITPVPPLSLVGTASTPTTVTAEVIPLPASSASQTPVATQHLPANANTASGKSVSMVTTLKPYSKPRRPKKPLNAIGVSKRQLVPRPLLYLPNNAITGQASKDKAEAPTPTNTTASVSLSPGSQAPTPAASSSKQETNTATLINHQLLALLQTVLLQQQNSQQVGVQQKQSSKQQQPPPTVVPSSATGKACTTAHTATTSSAAVASTPPVVVPSALGPWQPAEVGGQVVNTTGGGGRLDTESDAELQGSIFNNLLAEHMPNFNIGDSPNKSRLFHTSSDTVNDLLRGLSATPVAGSIERLSKETEAVLPTFAKALEASVSAENVSEDTPAISGQFDEHEQANEFAPTTAGGFDRRLDENEADVAPNLNCLANDDFGLPSDNDELLPPPSEASNESLGDFLATFNESNLSQRLEQIDFSDVFSQLKDVLKTPDKRREESLQPHIKDGGASIGGILDILGSPERNKSLSNNTTALDPTYKAVMDEASVDYIQKFKELASRMNSEMS